MPSKPFIHKEAKFWLEWFVRRSRFDVNIYRLNEDGTRGGIISELSYPKVSGIGFSDFTQEAVHIAGRELAEFPDCAHEGAHTDECRRVVKVD